MNCQGAASFRLTLHLPADPQKSNDFSVPALNKQGEPKILGRTKHLWWVLWFISNIDNKLQKQLLQKLPVFLKVRDSFSKLSN